MKLNSFQVILTGYGLLKTTTPNENELYESLSPELKGLVDKQRKTRLLIEQQQRKKLEQGFNNNSNNGSNSNTGDVN